MYRPLVGQNRQEPAMFLKLFLRANFLFLPLACLVSVLVLLPTGLAAQDAPDLTLESDEGNALFEQEPGFPECLGPDDPFCPRGTPGEESTGGSGDGGGCFDCAYFPEGPNGEGTEGWQCISSFSTTTESYANCTEYIDEHCALSKLCQIV